MAVSLAACGGSSSDSGSSTTTTVGTVAMANNGGAFSLTSTVSGVSLPSSTAAKLYINDSATNAYTFELDADTIGSGKITFEFADANDTITLTSASDLGNVTEVEVMRGTVDFSALADADFNVTTLTVNSGAVLTVDQATELNTVSGGGNVTVLVVTNDDVSTVSNWIASKGVVTTINLAKGTGATITDAQLTAGNATIDAAITAQINAGIGQVFTLTAGVDSGAAFTGGAGDDTFNAYMELDPAHGDATVETLTAFDALDGGEGTDTLNVRAVGNWTAPTTASVQNIEVADVRGDGAITINTAAWTGLISLTTSSVGTVGQDNTNVTAAATTDVTAVITAQAGSSINTTGGEDVTLTSTGQGSGAITVGFNTAAAGNVFISSTGVVTGGGITATAAGAITIIQEGDTGGAITVNDGTIINVAQTATIVGGFVTVNGGDNTTEVSVSHTGAGTAADVLITDGQAATDEADSITTVTLAGYGNSTIESGALTTLNLSGTAGTLVVNGNVAGADQTATTLALNLNGLSGTNTVTLGAVSDDSSYTTVNLNSSTAASTLANLAVGGNTAQVTALNISGNAALTLGDQTALTATAAITSVNTAGVTLSTALAVGQSFTGGDGADEVTVGATTEAISMGGGDDTVNMTAVLGADGALDGGSGTNTLAMDAATATLLTTEQAVTNFEKVSLGRVAQGASDTLDLANLPGVNYVISAGVSASTVAPVIILTTIDGNGSPQQGGAAERTFGQMVALNAGESITVDGITVIADSDLTDAEVAEAFHSAYADLTPSGAILPAGARVEGTRSGDYYASNFNAGSNFVFWDGINAGNLPDLTYTSSGAQASLVVDNLASGGAFELTDTLVGDATVNVTDAATGTDDVLNVVLNGTSNITNTGSLIVADVETINITATDSDTANNPAAASVIKLDAGAATSITVTGNHGVDFTGSTLTHVVTLDASAVVGTGATAAAAATAGAVTFTSAVTNENVTVTTANGDDVINVSSITDATKGATVSTGTGNDTVTGSIGADNITAGEGDDDVTAGAGADTVNLGDGNDVVTGGDGADLLTGGAGRDRFAYNLGESLATSDGFDEITDFGLVTAAVDATDLNLITNIPQDFATAEGGANADLLDYGVSILAASAITQFSTQQMAAIGAATGSDVLVTDDVRFAISTKGVISLSGADAAKVDTLAEWLAIADDLTGTNAGTAAAFEFDGSTYVFVEDATDALIKLTDVDLGAANGLVLIGQQQGTMDAAVGDILIY
jgi:S-layer protein